jgi:hypothetical protein
MVLFILQKVHYQFYFLKVVLKYIIFLTLAYSSLYISIISIYLFFLFNKTKRRLYRIILLSVYATMIYKIKKKQDLILIFFISEVIKTTYNLVLLYTKKKRNHKLTMVMYLIDSSFF